jgi:putative transposase
MEEDLDFLAGDLISVATQTGIELCGWTLLPDHYHFIATIAEGRSLAKFAAHFHGRTSRLINLRRETQGQRVWRQYWDTLLRSDGDYWSRMNYMWWNPVRHGYVETPEDWR